ncbi:MAG: type II toxin-antitoxin system HicB family antitoxin [Oscillospiraceae bacterium]|nr:type II toxin-antitoxin system HicB family antitoxin [Oscillospiraceae bacterium]
MKNMMEYKDYCGTVEYSAADNILYGKVLGIKGLISYEGDSIQSLKEDFENVIDDYLESCTKDGVEPQKPYKGTFNVRIAPHLHRSLAAYAIANGQTLNATVEEAIRHYVG